MKRLLHLILSCSLCIFFSACSKSETDADLHKFIEETKKTPAQPIEPLPGVKIVDKFNYNAANMRDPFTQVVKRSQKPDQRRAKEPLEAYSLDSLKMVGTLVEGEKVWGIVVAPDQTVYKVKIGDHLGQRSGEITAIKPTEIEILETIPQGESWQQRKTSLVLK